MRRIASVGIIVLATIALSLYSHYGARPALANAAQLQIISVDAAGHPEMDISVIVRDQFGQGVKGLSAERFTIEEHGRVIPGEAIQAAPMRDMPMPATLAIVADMSPLLGKEQLARLRTDAQALVKQISRNKHAALEIGIFAPRSNQAGSEQRVDVLPFTADGKVAAQTFAQLEPRSGQTDLYNAVVTAINAVVDRAEQRGGPAYVIVLGDGLDRTSIVGAGSAGANEAARIAEDRNVRVFAFGYGNGLGRGGDLLNQLAERADGAYWPKPDAAALKDVIGSVGAGATEGAYRLQYVSSLPADGAEHPLSVRVQLDEMIAATETRYLAPRPWDGVTPIALDVQLDARAYPDVVVWARPTNRLRRTVPNLSAADFRLMLDGAPLDAPLTITTEPLATQEPSVSQSVALVVEQHGPTAQQLRELAAQLLQSSDLHLSRMALFVPGVPSTDATFTHDHNALTNTLNNHSIGSTSGGSVGATLQRAIDEAARDGDAHSRPAHVILLADTPPSPDERARALTRARDLGVTIHIVGQGGQTEATGLAHLATATDGIQLTQPSQDSLQELALRIAQDSATRYRIAFQSPLLADGQSRELTLSVGELQAGATFIPLIPGAVTLNPPLPIVAQALIFLLTAAALIAATILPRIISDRRQRCPTCGKIRRASWGKSCLFCERDVVDQAAGSVRGALEAFALQGASLAREHTPGPSKRLSGANGSPTPFPVLQAPGAAQEQPDHHVETPDRSQPAQQEIATPQGARIAVEADADVQNPVDQARVQTHTDFWGPLPDEPEPPARETRVIAEATSTATPPPLPVFTSEAFPTVRKHPGEQLPQSVHEPTHTDFWGPLPEEEQ